MENNQDSCCVPSGKKGKGILNGIIYSLIPHTFCIAFIVFSIIGSVAATALFKSFLVIPYFFTFLVVASFLLATFSAFIYLKRNNCLCFSGIKIKWRYLVTLYSTMILINLAMFMFVFPALANMDSNGVLDKEKYDASLSMAVRIPCSGHAPLIIDELKKDNYIGQVTFRTPNIFDVKYDSKGTSLEKILGTEIFKTYWAEIK